MDKNNLFEEFKKLTLYYGQRIRARRDTALYCYVLPVVGAGIVFCGFSGDSASTLVIGISAAREAFRFASQESLRAKRVVGFVATFSLAASSALASYHGISSGTHGRLAPQLAFATLLFGSFSFVFKKQSGMNIKEMVAFYRENLWDSDDQGPPPNRPRMVDRAIEKVKNVGRSLIPSRPIPQPT